MSYLIIAFALLCVGLLLMVNKASRDIAIASREMIEICQHMSEMYLLNSHKGGATFMCYYCHERFPMSQQEVIGKYYFCIEHGSQRKQRLLKEECGVSQS